MSICLISVVKIILFIGLDIGALTHRNSYLDERVQEILYENNRTIGTISDILYNIPGILLGFDLAAFILGWLILALCIPCIYCHRLKKNKCSNIQDFRYYCFALTVIPLIVSCLTPVPIGAKPLRAAVSRQ